MFYREWGGKEGGLSRRVNSGNMGFNVVPSCSFGGFRQWSVGNDGSFTTDGEHWGCGREIHCRLVQHGFFFREMSVNCVRLRTWKLDFHDCIYEKGRGDEVCRWLYHAGPINFIAISVFDVENRSLSLKFWAIYALLWRRLVFLKFF